MSGSSEAAAVVASPRGPATVTSLIDDLNRLGLVAGSVVLVHTSLSALGWVAGGAQAVIVALQRTLGAAGTLMMPTHTAHLSEPSRWRHPPIPESWWPIVRAELPAFDPALTPTRGMGSVAETFRKHAAARRSAHPLTSFVAVGPAADAMTADHRPGCGFGEESPLGHLYRANGHVLLLGAGHANNTSLHLAEYRAQFPDKRHHEEGSPVVVDGERRWVRYEELVWNDSDFAHIGEAFGATGAELTGKVGIGSARLMRQRELVDFAVGWMGRNR